jgi:hypothetical protein
MLNTESLQWDGEGEQQSICIRVWDWSHFVSISSNDGFQVRTECYGLIVDGAKALEGTQVLSEITSAGTPASTHPGILRLDANDESIALRMTIGVSEASFDQLSRVFASSSSEGQLWINLTVTNSNWSHPQFWKSGWQECDLTIKSFDLVYKGYVTPSQRELGS